MRLEALFKTEARISQFIMFFIIVGRRDAPPLGVASWKAGFVLSGSGRENRTGK
jgi:hypothetical protein